MSDNRTAAREAYLPTVGMPGEVQGVFRCGRVIGNFCGMFFNDAFLGLDTNRAKVAFAPLPRGGELTWQLRFN